MKSFGFGVLGNLAVAGGVSALAISAVVPLGAVAQEGPVESRPGQDDVSDEAAAAEQSGRLDTIYVTATKRQTALNDTPLSIAAIGSEEIQRKNLAEMTDYLRTTPGANYIEDKPENPQVVIRGLTTNAQADVAGRAATGIYFGDVPLNGSTGAGAANLRMVDLERVEVLRGPQGTLFGAGTFAGAVRNIPKAPQLDVFEGSFKGTLSQTAGKGSVNDKFEAVVNIPIVEDRLALRAVAYRHQDSGYIDNIAGTVLAADGELFGGRPVSDYVPIWGGEELFQNRSGVGQMTITGWRASLLWQPWDALDVTLTHVYQETEQHGNSYVEVANADLAGSPYVQSTANWAGSDYAYTAALEAGVTDMSTNLTNLVFELDLGWANIVSSSAYSKLDRYSTYDLTGFYGFPVTSENFFDPERFVQEVRLASQFDGPYQFLLGAYYDQDEQLDFRVNSALTTEVATTFGARLTDGVFNGLSRFDETKQSALFGEASYEITNDLEFVLGARYFDVSQTQNRRNYNAATDTAIDLPEQEASETGLVYKANLSYRPNDDMLFYALWSQGFRMGGFNPANPGDSNPQLSTIDANNDGIVDGTITAFNSAFDSDRTDNYELGAKLSLLDRRLQLNASLYRVDWSGIPVQVIGEERFFPATLDDPVINNFAFKINGGEARSQGLELEASYQLTPQLAVNLGGAYTDAKLLTDIAEIQAVDGDRLSNAPKVSFNTGISYEDELAGRPVYLNANYAYVGGFYGYVSEKGLEAGDYSDVRVSVGVSLNSNVDLELFGTNLLDTDAFTDLENGRFFDSRAYIMRPRTVGANIRARF